MTTPTVTVNGEQRAVTGVEPHVTALDWLRDQGLTGAKEGCAEGECGACSAPVARPDGAAPDGSGRTRWTALNACLVPALALDGQEVVTAEGLGRPGALHPVQREMAVRGGSQCGYCTPGFICSMAAEYYRPDRAVTDPATTCPTPRSARGGRPAPDHDRRSGHQRARRRGQRARPQRVRPARAEREPLPLHRLPADPRRRLRPRVATRGRRPGQAVRVARAGGRVHPGTVGTGRVRPSGDPRRRAGAAGRAAVRHGDRRLHGLGGRGQPPRHPRPVRGRRGPAARAAHVLRGRGRRRGRRGAHPLRGRAAARRAGAAARPAVAAVRLPADPQRSHPRRQPRHRLPHRGRAARAARARGVGGAGGSGGRARGAAGVVLHRVPPVRAGAGRAHPRRADPAAGGPDRRLPQDRQAAVRRHLQRRGGLRPRRPGRRRRAGRDRARRRRGDAAARHRHRGRPRREALDRGHRARRGGGAARRGHPDRRPPGQRRLPRGDARPEPAQVPHRDRPWRCRHELRCTHVRSAPSSGRRSRTRAPSCTSPASRCTPTTWSTGTPACSTPTRCRPRTPMPG